MEFAKAASNNQPISLSDEERKRHVYLIGRTGSGKSTALEHFIFDDVITGTPFVFIDPHGQSAARIIDGIPKEHQDRVIYLDPTLENAPAFNPFDTPGEPALIASNILGSVKNIWWPEAEYPLTEWVLYNVLATLLERPQTHIGDIKKLLSKPKYREKVVTGIKDPGLRTFWEEEWLGYTKKDQQEVTRSIGNKIGQLVANPYIKNVLCKPSTFRLEDIWRKGYGVVINLNMGRLGEAHARILGSLIISMLKSVAFQRKTDDPPVRIYIDEFHEFDTSVIQSIATGGRKYGMQLMVAHQLLKQISDKTREALLGSVRTVICYTVSVTDAVVLAKEFHPLDPSELAKQSPFEAWISRGISRPYPIKVHPPNPPARQRFLKVLGASRRLFGS